MVSRSILPPLRDRGVDISILARHYLSRYSRELGKSVVDITPEADEILRQYPWPGNVRQLQSVLRQAILHTPGQVLLADFLPSELRNDALRRSEVGQSSGESSATFERFIDEQLRDGATSLYADAVTLLERLLLTRVLKHTAGNQSQAAKILGITRGSLRNKIRQLRITIGPVVSIDEDQDEDPEPSLETIEH